MNWRNKQGNDTVARLIAHGDLQALQCYKSILEYFWHAQSLTSSHIIHNIVSVQLWVSVSCLVLIWWLRGSTGFLKVLFVINKQDISSRALKVHLTNEGLWCQVHTLKLWPFLNKPCSLNMMPQNCFMSHCNCTCNNNGSKCNKSKVLLLSQWLVFKQHILYTCPKAIAAIDSVHVWISGWNGSHHFLLHKSSYWCILERLNVTCRGHAAPYI